MLAWTFRHGWLTISLGLASVAVSLVLATQLKLRMVPFADRDPFAVEIYLLSLIHISSYFRLFPKNSSSLSNGISPVRS